MNAESVQFGKPWAVKESNGTRMKRRKFFAKTNIKTSSNRLKASRKNVFLSKKPQSADACRGFSC
jgi:hypothetical protein